jgi:hypothetical protein
MKQTKMEKKQFSLELRDNNKLVRIFQVIFGALCIAVAGYWLVYNIKAVRSDGTLWVTVVFITGFGAYLIWSGFGYGYRFIEFSDEMIRMKKNPFLPPVNIIVSEVELIEIYPLKFIVKLKSSKTLLTRFGVSDIEKIELIKDEIIKFATDHNMPLEIKNEM